MLIVLIGILAVFLILSGIFLFVQYKSNYQLQLALQSEREKFELEDKKSKETIVILKNKLDRATEDPITHLLGWQLFEDRLNQMIKESKRYNITMGLLLIDIDDFKVINEALSYETGDKLLLEMAQRMQPCIRSVDSISRFAKDTFVVLLSQLSKPETAAIVAQRIIQSLSQPFDIDQNELYITVGIGITVYPNDATDASSLYRTGSQALHAAKEKGKNVYQFYQPKETEDSQRELLLATGLKRSSLEDELSISYQPIMKDGKVFCMDALLNWHHPELGIIAPNELFDYAEKQQKLNSISQWLLENACKQFLEWKKNGFEPELLGIPVAIKQLENTPFLYSISQILQQFGFSPKQILLEIKENPSELSFESLEKAFNILRYLDINIAIDNFGSGSYSFRHLKNFRINFIKLDEMLIDDIEIGTQSVALVKSMVYMTKALGIELIIQGVMNANQVKILRQLGCIYLQGKYFGQNISYADALKKFGQEDSFLPVD